MNQISDPETKIKPRVMGRRGPFLSKRWPPRGAAKMMGALDRMLRVPACEGENPIVKVAFPRVDIR